MSLESTIILAWTQQQCETCFSQFDSKLEEPLRAFCLNSLTGRLVIFLVWRLGLRAKAVYADCVCSSLLRLKVFFSCLRHGMSYDLRNSIMTRDVVYAFPVEFISFSHNAYTISRIIMPLLRSYHVSCRKLIAPFTLTALERTLLSANGLGSINWKLWRWSFLSNSYETSIVSSTSFVALSSYVGELLNKRWRARLRLNTKELGMWRMY